MTPTDTTLVLAWLAKHPAPWTVKRAGTLTGPEYDVLDATGAHVQGLSELFKREEPARAYAAMANELARAYTERQERAA